MAQSGTDRATRRVAVFLDRDGVINRRAPEGDYIARWSEFEFLPGSIEALAALHAAGAELFVVTNQRGVARGLVAPSDVDDIHSRMTAALDEAGVPLGGVFTCPHEIGVCDCRKPAIGLFEQARAAHTWIDFTRSHVVGDSLSDIEAGKRIGAVTWLVGDDFLSLVPELSRRGLTVAGGAASLSALVADGRLITKVEHG
jgi:D-glycero-D-manno-heptose 1,7-bisphosphate phosphatase